MAISRSAARVILYLVFFSGIFCDIQKHLLSSNLQNFENSFLEDEYARAESQTSSLRVVRSVEAGWVSLSKNGVNLIEGDSDNVTCSGASGDLIWRDSSNKNLKTSSEGMKIEPVNKKNNQTKLIISKAKTKYAGTYWCFNSRSNKFANFTLTVFKKPKAKASIDGAAYEVGDDVVLRCEGKNSKSNLTWTSDGTKVPINPLSTGKNRVIIENRVIGSKLTSTLTFKNVTIARAGKYKCIERVLHKEDSDSVTVQINPVAMHFSTKDEESVKENSEFSIKCWGKVDQIWWTYSDGSVVDLNNQADKNVYVKPVKYNGRVLEQALYFENVELNSNGRYICFGHFNATYIPIQRAFSLKVIENNFLENPIIRSRYPPMSNQEAKVSLNHNFTAACIGQTEDIEWLGPPYNWKIGEKSILTPIYTESISVFKNKYKLLLRFQNVSSVEAEGTYICRVRKRDKTASSEFKLSVIIPLSFNQTPSKYSANETHDIKLECVVNGRPKPEVLWYKNDRPIITESRISYDSNSLIIKNISYQNAGKYICRAKQPSIEDAMIEQAVTLQVFHKPYFSHENETIERLKNVTSTIECYADADPPAHYTWYRDDQVVTAASGSLASNLTNGTIELLMLSNTEYEILTCEATNSFGSSKQKVNVTAMQLPSVPEVKICSTNSTVAKYSIVAPRNASITHFDIEYKEKSSNEWNESSEAKADSRFHEYILDELAQSTDYVIRVRSVNAIGASAFSKEVEFKTSSTNQLTTSIQVLLAAIIITIVIPNTRNNYNT